MGLPVDITALPKNIRENLAAQCTRDAAVEAKKAVARQRKIAKHYRDHTPRALDCIGEQHMAVDPYFASYFRHKEKVDFYQDTDFRKWLPKRHEEFRVQSSGSKLSVGFSRRFSSNFDSIFRSKRSEPATKTKSKTP